jgi:hypothetical protein
MAKAVGVSPSSVRRIWAGQGLQPHRVRAFKISNDRKFADRFCSCAPSRCHRERRRAGLYARRRGRRVPPPW